jgi:hypothetical protein
MPQRPDQPALPQLLLALVSVHDTAGQLGLLRTCCGLGDQSPSIPYPSPASVPAEAEACPPRRDRTGVGQRGQRVTAGDQGCPPDEQRLDHGAAARHQRCTVGVGERADHAEIVARQAHGHSFGTEICQKRGHRERGNSQGRCDRRGGGRLADTASGAPPRDAALCVGSADLAADGRTNLITR